MFNYVLEIFLGKGLKRTERYAIMNDAKCKICKQDLLDYCPSKLKFKVGNFDILVSAVDVDFACCVNCVVNTLVKELYEFQNDYIHNHINEPEINGGDNK